MNLQLWCQDVLRMRPVGKWWLLVWLSQVKSGSSESSAKQHYPTPPRNPFTTVKSTVSGMYTVFYKRSMRWFIILLGRLMIVQFASTTGISCRWTVISRFRPVLGIGGKNGNEPQKCPSVDGATYYVDVSTEILMRLWLVSWSHGACRKQGSLTVIRSLSSVFIQNMRESSCNRPVWIIETGWLWQAPVVFVRQFWGNGDAHLESSLF